ncbi:hypothetical protein Ccrd_003101 [Cynara cardunculus var. scolymus]|uniref:Uncharacterized protein n=1 Tax=Cynara cardunculus var. scolymus TaxID=59895 RepID=A0A103XQ43_CYNCS|nr:hypothetical protein Ccrd_003101 [Cynara cardunculus var. scolymus]
MHSHHLLLEEPIRMASILEPSKPSFFPAMTKIVGTLGPRSRSVETISSSKQRERTATLLCYLCVFFLHRQQTARTDNSLAEDNRLVIRCKTMFMGMRLSVEEEDAMDGDEETAAGRGREFDSGEEEKELGSLGV